MENTGEFEKIPTGNNTYEDYEPVKTSITVFPDGEGGFYLEQGSGIHKPVLYY